MSITKKYFGTTKNGKEVTCFTITDKNGMEAEILDYGATIRCIRMPDKNGKVLDVVLGYDTLEEYMSNNGYFGTTVGRFANRIGAGKFTLNGKEYSLVLNNGANHLHGGNVGFNQYVWDAKILDENSLEFSMVSPDGDEGYPGTLKLSVVMNFKDGAFSINYRAVSDKDTIINLTNHSYFNLNGGVGTIHDHLLTVNSDSFTINDEGCLPTGEIVSVENTAMDFRTEHTIGERVDSDDPSVKNCGGYDSNFILSGSPAAVVRSLESGIAMTVTTDQPGMQLYTGNNISKRNGKNGAQYGFRSAFCMETQHYPDCINHPEWPSCILKANEEFKSFTTYTFAVK